MIAQDHPLAGQLWPTVLGRSDGSYLAVLYDTDGVVFFESDDGLDWFVSTVVAPPAQGMAPTGLWEFGNGLLLLYEDESGHNFATTADGRAWEHVAGPYRVPGGVVFNGIQPGAVSTERAVFNVVHPQQVGPEPRFLTLVLHPSARAETFENPAQVVPRAVGAEVVGLGLNTDAEGASASESAQQLFVLDDDSWVPLPLPDLDPGVRFDLLPTTQEAIVLTSTAGRWVSTDLGTSWASAEALPSALRDFMHADKHGAAGPLPRPFGTDKYFEIRADPLVWVRVPLPDEVRHVVHLAFGPESFLSRISFGDDEPVVLVVTRYNEVGDS